MWDQSERYLAAFNWADEEAVLELKHSLLPRQVTVVLTSNSSVPSMDLPNLRMGPKEAVLFKFPYKAV